MANKIFNNFTTEEHTNFLANFLPNGKLFTAKFLEQTNLRKYLKGKSVEFQRVNDLFVTFINELDPNNTTDFLEEWESAIKIPDDCIPLASTVEERRENIVLKLTSLSVQTVEQFTAMALGFGFTITFSYIQFPPFDVPATPLEFIPVSAFPPFDVPATPNFIQGSKFEVIVQSDFDTNPTKANILQCLFKKLSISTYKFIFVSN